MFGRVKHVLGGLLGLLLLLWWVFGVIGVLFWLSFFCSFDDDGAINVGNEF